MPRGAQWLWNTFRLVVRPKTSPPKTSAQTAFRHTQGDLLLFSVTKGFKGTEMVLRKD